MDPREERGLIIAATSRIVPKEGYFLVPSQSGAKPYRVHLNPADTAASTCTCPDYEKRGEPCKHVYAVKYAVQREMRPDGSVTLTESITLTQTTTVAPRPTYRQDWPKYNAAQMKEKARFRELLRELCDGIEEPAQRQRGRRRNRLADMVFCCVYKTYTGLSARRLQTDMDEAAERGFITKAPNFNSVLNYMADPEITPLLHRLVVESSQPLKAIETDFAVDSSGFMSSRFDRWYDHKYGKFMRRHSWVKVHIMTGVRTNVITAVEILDKNANDCPQLPALVATTSRSFDVKEVSADKEYLSRENVNAIVAAGASPYIAIKKTTTGNAGGLFGQMYHRFCLNRDEYMAKYHKRSNIESTFAMVKGKFGDHVRSKTDEAMVNEALCKLIGHNLCCLISAIYELGVEPEFWRVDEPEALPLPAPAPQVVEEDPVEMWAWV